MSRLSLRCLAVIGISCMGMMPVVEADVLWTANFPSAGSTATSRAFVVGDGRHVVSVALSGAVAEKGVVQADRRTLPSEPILDPVSRLVVFRLSGPPGQSMALDPSVPCNAGTIVRIGGGGSGKCSGWVKRVEGKILPLALVKIDYEGGVPLPGTPLMDASGRVIAVAHQSTSATSGYAITAEVVKRVLDDVQRGGRVARGWIGLNLLPQAPEPKVTRVQEGSPCDIAGVKAGDTLLQIGPRRLDDYADAVNAFFFLRPGVSVPVRVSRGGQELTLTVTPVERRDP